MTERVQQTRRKAPLPQRTPEQMGVPVAPEPLAVQRQALTRHGTRPQTAQRHAVGPVLRAARLDRQEHARLEQERVHVQRQVDVLGEMTTVGRQADPRPVPDRPTTPAEWVTVMRLRAEEVAGRPLDARSSSQFAALQRQVAQTLAQGFRSDRGDPQTRYATYGEHLATLQRHPVSAPVSRVVLGLVPPAERLPLQRAVNETLQRFQAQEQAALNFDTRQTLQRQLAELDAEATQPVLQRIQARRGSGNPLPEAIQRHLEQGLNHDLSRVRIHDDAEADKLAKGVNAIAFTTGTDIFFQSGRFNPNTQSGLELLAHEVTHTVQQSQGRVGTGIDPDAGLEAEARATGTRLAQTTAKRIIPAARPLAPLTPGRGLQRLATPPPSWNTSANPAILEQMIQKDMQGFLRQLLGRALLDQTHYATQNRANPGTTPSFGKIVLDSIDHLPVNAASRRKVLDAAIQQAALPDWVRLQIAQTAIQLRRTDLVKAQAVAKVLAAKVQPDHIGDFGLALFDRVVDTVVGLYKLAKFVAWDSTTVRLLVDPVGYAKMWVNISSTLAAITQNPRLLWDALSKDVRDAWSRGAYGKALGYLTFDMASVATAIPGAARAAATVPGRLRVVMSVARDSSGRIVTRVTQVGEDVARSMSAENGTQLAAAGGGGTRAPTATNPTTARATANAPTVTGNLRDPGPLTGLARQLALAQRCTNWSKVQPLLGTKAGLTNLPPGYQYARVPLHGGGFDQFAYLPQTVSGWVPKLKADKAGNWQPAGLSWERTRSGYTVRRDYRIAQSSEYTKTNPPPNGFSGATNNHHLTADNVMRNAPIFREAFVRGLVSPDRGPNMLHLAVSPQMLTQLRQAGINMSDVLHYTSHPKYDALVAQELADAVLAWQTSSPPRLPLRLSAATDQQLLAFVTHFDQVRRTMFFRDIQRLQKVLRSDGSLSALPGAEEVQRA